MKIDYRDEYVKKFNCKLPIFLMMESEEKYQKELKGAIERGYPIGDDEERRPDVDKDGNDILY